MKKMILYVFALACSFNAYSLSVTREVSKSVIGNKESINVKVTIVRDGLTGVAKLVEIIPVGFSPAVINKAGGKALVGSKGELKIQWLTLPGNDKIVVEYRLLHLGVTTGSAEITGTLTYMENKAMKKYAIDPSTITVGSSTGEPIKQVVKKSAESLAAEKKKENERKAAIKLAKENKLELQRIAAEKKAAAEKVAVENARNAEAEAVAEKLSKENKLEADRIAGETKAEEARVLAEKQKEDEETAAVEFAKKNKLALERSALEKEEEREKIAAESARITEERLLKEGKLEADRLKAALDDTKPVDETVTVKDKEATGGVIYRVQIGAYSNKKDVSIFDGLPDVHFKKINGLYKYYIGGFSTKSDAETLITTAESNGFEGAFVVTEKMK